jgi:two-component system OmpR family sensor kinase
MDGRRGGLKYSLQTKLSVWLSIVILTVAILAGAFSFASSFQEAIELQDAQLQQIAGLLNKRSSIVGNPLQIGTEQADPEENIAVRLLQAANSGAPEPNGPLSTLTNNLPDGLQTVSIKGQNWRVFVGAFDSTTRLVVGQLTVVRDEIARDSALRVVVPFLVLLPILILLVSLVTRSIFKPLKQLAHELDSRAEQDLREVDTNHLPSEIRPLVFAMNTLLSRVAHSVALQRRFVADASHELRSPLTALSLQAERLSGSDLPTQARNRLTVLRGGIQRAQKLLEQLLSLARVQEPALRQAEPISIQVALTAVLEDLIPLAHAKNIELSVSNEGDAKIIANPLELQLMFKNLVDNAIRYSPHAGRVDINVYADANRIVFQVDDIGPGIPEPERALVLDPFYRALGNDETGSGLGLSIVRTVAHRLDAKIQFGFANENTKRGLRAKIIFAAHKSAP